MPTNDLPQRAQVVIVGGGAVGCSVAYHLAKLGWTDVVLIEQGQLSCGTTWHAAGVVGQLRTHPSLTRLMLHSSQLYAGLEAEVGLGTGWNQCGALWIAASVAFTAYVANFSSYDKTYGSLGAPIVLLFWLYLLAVFLLLGGELNALLDERRATASADQR